MRWSSYPPPPLPPLQLLYKQVMGKMVLHREPGGTLSLLCTLRHPPRFFLGRLQTPSVLGSLFTLGRWAVGSKLVAGGM